MSFKDTLNQTLLEKNKVTDEQIDNLQKVYKNIAVLFEISDVPDINPKFAKELALEMEFLEFELQENWNFPKDKNYHTWWNKFKYCTCPKMDNDERFGYEKIISSDCPFHGSKIKD